MTREVNFLRFSLFTHFHLCSVLPPSPVPGIYPRHVSIFPIYARRGEFNLLRITFALTILIEILPEKVQIEEEG